jgi:phenylalanyl-tRNA synthetase beta chain
MKILLSWLREFADVKTSADEIATLMGVRGFAVEGIEGVGDDSVIDFEVTGNRPDCMSVIGIAREVATAYDVELHTRGAIPASPVGPIPASPVGPIPASPVGPIPASPVGPIPASPVGPIPASPVGPIPASPVGPTPASPVGPISAPLGPIASSSVGATGASSADIRIEIEAPDLCTRYVGALADVTIGPSPDWMQRRLTAGGIRPISNIVDITNYVLLELGQPMHAFDYAKIAERAIRVRRAYDGERLRTLDDTDRALDDHMLVIADAREPMAVGGVKGGALSEITAATTTIVFEAAHFNPLSVRRTSRKMGLKTDASMRFERGTDPALPLVAMHRALELLQQIGAGTPRGPIVDCHPVTVEPRVLVLREAKLRGLLGAGIDGAEVLRILTRLGFTVSDLSRADSRGVPAAVSAGAGWAVTVPTRRVDVQREVDLIEEIARHVGLDRIPSTYPKPSAGPRPSDPRIAQARRLRSVMTGIGFSEGMTFGFVGEAEAMPFAADGDLVPIANPLSENFAVLRPSALPGLVAAVAHNRRREQRDVRLFEVGNRFSRSMGERRSLACVWTGAAGGDHWSGGRRDVDFFDIKAVAERVALALGLDVRTEAHAEPWLAPGRAAALLAGTARIATFGQLRPAIAERHGLPPADDVYVAEIDLEAADALSAGHPGGTGGPRLRVTPLPRFPSVTRDIAILVADTLPAATLRDTVRAAAPATLASVREFDRYQGKGIPDGQISLALRLTFRSPERTLTDAEVQSAMDAVLAALKTQHAAVQR